jgi:hypothetical protein
MLMYASIYAGFVLPMGVCVADVVFHETKTSLSMRMTLVRGQMPVQPLHTAIQPVR